MHSKNNMGIGLGEGVQRNEMRILSKNQTTNRKGVDLLNREKTAQDEKQIPESSKRVKFTHENASSSDNVAGIWEPEPGTRDGLVPRSVMDWLVGFHAPHCA